MVSLVCAQPLVGTWFSPGGEYHACLINPAMPCPQTDFSASEAERVVHQQVISDLRFWQNSVATYADSTQKMSEVLGGLDFRMRFVSLRGSSLGLGVSVPYPRRTLDADSVRFVQAQDAGQASLLLGSDLVYFLTGNEKAAHRLLLDFEIPIAYEPGLWAAHLEWLWKAGLRVRGSVWSVAPRQDWVLSSDNTLGNRMRWHEQIGQLLIAARPVSWLDLGARGTWSQVDSRARSGELGAAGDVAQAGGLVRFSHGSWRFSHTLEFQKEAYELAWQDTGDFSPFWAVGTGQYNQIWVYQSRLQKTIDPLRYGFWTERRLWNSRTNSGRGETDLFGMELRYSHPAFSVEPGVAWVNGGLQVRDNPWADYNGIVSLGDVGSYQALIASCNITIVGGGNRIQYSYSQAFARTGSLGQSGASASWGAQHRVTITGNL